MKYDITARMFINNTNNNVIAYGNVIIDQLIHITNLRVLETKTETGEKKWFLVMPRKKDANGNYFDLISPRDQEFRKALEVAVFSAIKEEMIKDLDVPQIQAKFLRIEGEKNTKRAELKAFATIWYKGVEIRDLKVMKNKEDGKLFILFPQVKYMDSKGAEKYQTIIYPTNQLVRCKLDSQVIRLYEEGGSR